MKQFKLFILFLSILTVGMQQVNAQRTWDSLSVYEIAPSYNVDTNYLNDTLNLINDINKMGNDYVAISKRCNTIASYVNLMILSLERDYEMRDSIIHIDSTLVISDYALHSTKMKQLASCAKNLSLLYKQKAREHQEELQRIEEEKLRKKMEEEQESRNRLASEKILAINEHHKTITSICNTPNPNTNSDEVLKLKDYYYAYLAIYNRYNLKNTNFSDQQIQLLSSLYSFQTTMIDSILGPNSYPKQIDSFKNKLKLRCGKSYPDVYKAYSRLFKTITTDITFTNINSFENHLTSLRNIITMQQLFTKTIELRECIDKTSLEIIGLYSLNYKEMTSSYKDVVSTLEVTPNFNSIESGKHFIQGLEEFKDIQQDYIYNVKRLDSINLRGDSIIAACGKKYGDIADAYRNLHSITNFTPAYKTHGESFNYTQRLDQFEVLQQYYASIINIRTTISQNDELIFEARNLDNKLVSGYKTIKDNYNLTPNFINVNGAEKFMGILIDFANMQNRCLQIIDDRKAIENTADIIRAQAKSYIYIGRSYLNLEKTYQYNKDIVTEYDLLDYANLLILIRNMQQTYIDVLNKPNCSDFNDMLKKVNDPVRIKNIMGIKD